MATPEPGDPAAGYEPSERYERIREQVETAPRTGWAGPVACAGFVLAGLLLLFLLEHGPDRQQILLAAIGLVVVNLITGVTWMTVARGGRDELSDTPSN